MADWEPTQPSIDPYTSEFKLFFKSVSLTCYDLLKSKGLSGLPLHPKQLTRRR